MSLKNKAISILKWNPKMETCGTLVTGILCVSQEVQLSEMESTVLKKYKAIFSSQEFNLCPWHH